MHALLLTTAVAAGAPLTDEQHCSYAKQQQEADGSVVAAAALFLNERELL
jgi:hypothetical protein